MEAIELRWWDHLLAAFFLIGVPALTLRGHRREMPSFGSKERIQLYWSNALTLWLGAALVLFAWRWAGRSWERLGLGPGEISHPGWTALLVGVVVVGMVLDSWLKVRDPERRAETRARWRRLTPFMPETGREVAHNTVLALSAGVTEEIVFRGFLILYTAALLAPIAGDGAAAWSLAVALPALACGLSHGYQLRRDMAKIVVLSAALGAIFLLTRSLWIPMALHVGIDLGMGFLSPWLLGEPQEPG